MLEFNERFAAERDAYGWTLTETIVTVRMQDDPTPKKRWKKGDKNKKTKQRHFGNFLQVCSAVLDLTAGECTSAQDCINAFGKSVKDISDTLKAMGKE